MMKMELKIMKIKQFSYSVREMGEFSLDWHQYKCSHRREIWISFGGHSELSNHSDVNPSSINCSGDHDRDKICS